MRHPDDARLNDYVDGRLEPASRVDVEAHLAECDACRERVEAIHGLGARLGSLPTGIPPRRDLRPPRPAPSNRQAGSGRSAAGGHRPWLRAAAVAALLAAGAAGTWLGIARTGDEPAQATESGRSPLAASYARAGDDLAAALRTRRSELSPQAARALDASLNAVDAAIRELQGADATGEGAVELARQLEARHRTRLELLRGALDLLEGS